MWNLSRDLAQPKVAHNVVVAALRQKYGKETYAAGPGGTPVTDDSQTQRMWWVFDEQGHLAPQAKIMAVRRSAVAVSTALTAAGIRIKK